MLMNANKLVPRYWFPLSSVGVGGKKTNLILSCLYDKSLERVGHMEKERILSSELRQFGVRQIKLGNLNVLSGNWQNGHQI